jgi:hypothetical protein
MIFLDRLALWLGRTSAWFFAVIVLVMVYEVVARYAFNAPRSGRTRCRSCSRPSPSSSAGPIAWPKARTCGSRAGRDAAAALPGCRNGWALWPGRSIWAGSRWRVAHGRARDLALLPLGAWDPERSGSTLNSPLPAYLKAILFVGAVLFLLVVLGRMIPRRPRLMDIGSITVLIVGAMAAMLMLGVPLAFVSGSIAVVLAVTQFGWNALFIVGSRTVEFLDSFALIAVPMFVLMASIMEKSGVARDLYRAFHVWAGSLRGGVGVVTVFVAVILGATTGVIGGEIVLLGLIALPQMLRLGYDRKLAIGIITAGGSLGTMIPPSIILIFYGLTAQVSISHLFLATLMPGLMLASMYVAYILIRCGLNPALGPPLGPEERTCRLPRSSRSSGA